MKSRNALERYSAWLYDFIETYAMPVLATVTFFVLPLAFVFVLLYGAYDSFERPEDPCPCSCDPREEGNPDGI